MEYMEYIKQRLTDTFIFGYYKRELISRNNNNIHLLIENDRSAPNCFDVLLMDGRTDNGNHKEFLHVGKNLEEEEALELALDFAKYCRLF